MGHPFQTVQSLEQEYDTLSKLRHKRIVSYLGVTYEQHPTQGKKCLFVMTEFMPGVRSNVESQYYVRCQHLRSAVAYSLLHTLH